MSESPETLLEELQGLIDSESSLFETPPDPVETEREGHENMLRDLDRAGKDDATERMREILRTPHGALLIQQLDETRWQYLQILFEKESEFQELLSSRKSDE